MRRPSALLVVAFLLSLPFTAATLSGQSLMGAGGLGVPVDPVDARGRALGSAGVGYFEATLLAHDPALAAGLQMPTITATFQPTSGQLQEGGEQRDFGGSRFPHFSVSLPFERGVFSVAFAGLLSQEWEARHNDVLELGGQSVAVEDVFRARGGVSTVRLGWARQMAPSLSVGAGAGIYLGSMERDFSRSFDEDQVGEDVEPFRTQGRWDAQGVNAQVGAVWDPVSALRLGGSVTWSGDLELSPDGGDEELERREYSLPLELRAGATGSLAPNLNLSLGVSYADWSDTGRDLREGGARGSAWSYGGGLEWFGPQFLGRSLPVRVGYRSADLPFLFKGEAVTESGFSGGFGLNLADTDQGARARFDLAVERGEREAAAFSEEFWRTTVTIRVAGG